MSHPSVIEMNYLLNLHFYKNCIEYDCSGSEYI